MKRLLLIGIGAGDPSYVTAQAVRALNRVDVFFAVEKGGDAGELVSVMVPESAFHKGRNSVEVYLQQ